MHLGTGPGFQSGVGPAAEAPGFFGAIASSYVNAATRCGIGQLELWGLVSSQLSSLIYPWCSEATIPWFALLIKSRSTRDE